jgi:hypothetical protein
LPGHEEEEGDADADGAIRDVERGEPNFVAASAARVEVEEIDDVAAEEAVEEIAGDAAEHEAECDLAWDGVDIEVMSSGVEDEEGDEGEESEHEVAGGIFIEEAPCGAGITPMDEVEETVDDDFFLLEPEVTEDGGFGDLIESKDDEGDRDHAAIWFGQEAPEEVRFVSQEVS